MAEDITAKGKDVGNDGGQSIPAMLAAIPAKASASIVKSVKAAASAATQTPAEPAPAAKVVSKPVVDAKPVAATPKPAPVKAESKPVKAAVPAPKPAPVAKAPAPVAKATPKPPVAAKAPAPVAKAVAPAPVAPVPAVAKAIAPTPTPPAAVPADSAKETKMATTIENAAQTTTDKAQAMFAETSERTKGAIAKSTKMVEEMSAFGKGNVEALVESSKIAAKGLETLGQDAAEFTRKSFEDASAAFKTLASVKSPTEFMKLQSDYIRSAFDAMVAESSRSTESLLKLAGEVAQPISNRVSVATDKMKVAA